MDQRMLVSLDAVKEFLPFRSGVTEYDGRLTTIVRSVSKQIETALRRDLSYGEKTEYFDTFDTSSIKYDFGGTGEEGVYLSGESLRLPLKGMGVLSDPYPRVFYDPSLQFGPTTELEAVRIHLDAENDRLILALLTRKAKNAIKVVYTSGYEADEQDVFVGLPEDIRMAALQQTIHTWNRTNPDAISGQHDRIQGNRYGVPVVTKGGLLPDVIAALMPYRRISMKG